MPFTEICIYQVKPQKVEEFEALMLEAKSLCKRQIIGVYKKSTVCDILQSVLLDN